MGSFLCSASKSIWTRASEVSDSTRREQPASHGGGARSFGLYPAQIRQQPRMNAVATAAPPTIHQPARATGWFPLAIFALVWLEVISRLRFEWTINPQYGYGWAVPLLAAYIFWRRWQNAPPPAAPACAAAGSRGGADLYVNVLMSTKSK